MKKTTFLGTLFTSLIAAPLCFTPLMVKQPDISYNVANKEVKAATNISFNDLSLIAFSSMMSNFTLDEVKQIVDTSLIWNWRNIIFKNADSLTTKDFTTAVELIPDKPIFGNSAKVTITLTNDKFVFNSNKKTDSFLITNIKPNPVIVGFIGWNDIKNPYAQEPWNYHPTFSASAFQVENLTIDEFMSQNSTKEAQFVVDNASKIFDNSLEGIDPTKDLYVSFSDKQNKNIIEVYVDFKENKHNKYFFVEDDHDSNISSDLIFNRYFIINGFKTIV